MMSNPGVNNEERFQEYKPIKANSTGRIALSTPPLLIAAESVEGAQLRELRTMHRQGHLVGVR